MKKLKIILFTTFVASILQIVLLGCSCDDCTGGPRDSDYAWANESGVVVRMIVVKDYPDNSKFTYEKIIADGDTLHGYNYDTLRGYSEYLNREWYPCSYPSEMRPKITKVKLVFLDEPEKCLIFDGKIEDSFDIRNHFLYKGRSVEKFRSLYEYTYTITPEHKAMAKEEDCSYILWSKVQYQWHPFLLGEWGELALNPCVAQMRATRHRF